MHIVICNEIKGNIAKSLKVTNIVLVHKCDLVGHTYEDLNVDVLEVMCDILPANATFN